MDRKALRLHCVSQSVLCSSDTWCNQATFALAGLLEEDATSSDNRMVDNAWRGAEAYHFFLLAQRQLYEGYMENAMRTGITFHTLHYRPVFEPLLSLHGTLIDIKQ